MQICEKFPKQGLCPICKTNMAGKCVLVPIDGTANDMNEKCEVIHLGCFDVRLDLNDGYWVNTHDMRDNPKGRKKKGVK